ncbi:type VI secretion system ImpA family N-terminal domain-containing protein [Pseudomonas aeruginosa]|nr:type VI secretion system ImpA family N-terminal domain-containing protein [Pseudomonas aeruginosa]
MSLVSTPTPLELDVLLAPFDPRQPAGVFDEEEESFQAIELEMVKLGGLHASSIDWAYVDTASRQYLVKNAKHFRVAGHLVVTRLRSQTWSAWAGAAGLLAGMVERFWKPAIPSPVRSVCRPSASCWRCNWSGWERRLRAWRRLASLLSGPM